MTPCCNKVKAGTRRPSVLKQLVAGQAPLFVLRFQGLTVWSLHMGGLGFIAEWQTQGDEILSWYVNSYMVCNSPV